MNAPDIYSKYPAAKAILDLMGDRLALCQALGIKSTGVSEQGVDLRLKKALTRKINHVQIFKEKEGEGYQVKFFQICNIDYSRPENIHKPEVVEIETSNHVPAQDVMKTVFHTLNMIDAAGVNEKDIENGNTIIAQLGGLNRLILSFSLKRHYVCKHGVVFHCITLAKGINAIQITVNSMDLYDLKFFKCGSKGNKLVKPYENVYVDQLREIIESTTENLII